MADDSVTALTQEFGAAFAHVSRSKSPWRVVPAQTEGVDAPSLWSIDQGPNA